MIAIGIGGNYCESEEFWQALKQCEFFILKYPRGGQYNDGYELSATFRRHSADELLTLLDTLNVGYQLHSTEPVLEKNAAGLDINWCRQIETNNGQQWLELNNWNTCLGHDSYIFINVFDFSVNVIATAKGSTSSWYAVSLAEVETALDIEDKLKSRGVTLAL